MRLHSCRSRQPLALWRPAPHLTSPRSASLHGERGLRRRASISTAVEVLALWTRRRKMRIQFFFHYNPLTPPIGQRPKFGNLRWRAGSSHDPGAPVEAPPPTGPLAPPLGPPF